MSPPLLMSSASASRQLRRGVALVLGLAAAPLAIARAQQSPTTGSVTATAQVLNPMTFTASQNLAFAGVVQNVSKLVAADDPGSGRWSFTGQGAANMSMTLTLPSTLVNGANTLPIASWAGRYTQGADAPGGTAFSPVSGTAATFVFPGTSSQSGQVLSFRLGATVTAAAAQVPVVYSGTISISAVYVNY